jgi:hypothetical protein
MNAKSAASKPQGPGGTRHGINLPTIAFALSRLSSVDAHGAAFLWSFVTLLAAAQQSMVIIPWEHIIVHEHLDGYSLSLCRRAIVKGGVNNAGAFFKVFFNNKHGWPPYAEQGS